jgi:hypothetical protein
MRIDGKIADGYVILCDREHAFMVDRLGISVQCPRCGECALSVELATNYILDQARDAKTAFPAIAASD